MSSDAWKKRVGDWNARSAAIYNIVIPLAPEQSRTVPGGGKLSREVPPGTLNSVLKQAGLK